MSVVFQLKLATHNSPPWKRRLSLLVVFALIYVSDYFPSDSLCERRLQLRICSDMVVFNSTARPDSQLSR